MQKTGRNKKMNDRTKDYVFMSYSHSNNIEKLLSMFDEKRYNIVYDDAMSYGDEWDLNARRYISNEKCKGVIFVMSEQAVVSKSILIEAEYTARYNRKHFGILYDNKTMTQIYDEIYNLQDENKKFIMKNIQDCFPGEELFAKMSDLKWDKIKDVFNSWGFESDDSTEPEPIQANYSTDMKGEKSRLNNQQQGYYEFDKKAINMVLDKFNRDELCVLDIGCSNGVLTISRFADEKRIKKVIGVDYNAKDIAEANQTAKKLNDKFVFYTVDLESPNVLDNINEILEKEGVGKADIVFGALVLHHLHNPNKLLLQLYDIMPEDGRIIIRGSDDGGKLCYPKSELLKEILYRYEKLVKTSDRSNGRKLYWQLYKAGYVGMQMIYSVVDTCGKDRKERERLFDVGFSFRLNRIDEMIALNPDNEELKKERKWFDTNLSALYEAFIDRSFWYSNTSYIIIAGVKE